jgi:hypothetical protein
MSIVIRSRASFLNEREKTTNTRIWFETMISNYSSNKALWHRFQSRTKTQAIEFTCALLFDLALLFWMREWKQQIHAFDLKRCIRFIRQTKSYNIVFNLEQRLKRSNSHVHCYSISRFFFEWERRSNKHTHLILYSNYSLDKVLQHRFQSRIKTQVIVFTCALLFDLALFFWMKEKKQQTHAFDLKWCFWVIRRTKFYNIVFDLEQRFKRSYSHVHYYSISRFSSEWEREKQ